MNHFVNWDRDMVAAVGDYQLRMWPNVADGWTWYVYLMAPGTLHSVAGGTAPDEASARAASETALFRRLAVYQDLAAAEELARLHRIEDAAARWRAARDAAISGGNWRPGEPAHRYDDACDVLAAVLAATGDGASGEDRAARIEAAARQVLASGQARYKAVGGYTDYESNTYHQDTRWTGDLVPAAAMQALRAAVEGGAQGLQADVPLMMQEATDG